MNVHHFDHAIDYIVLYTYISELSRAMTDCCNNIYE